jgi:hypothetical protein
MDNDMVMASTPFLMGVVMKGPGRMDGMMDTERVYGRMVENTWANGNGAWLMDVASRHFRMATSDMTVYGKMMNPCDKSVTSGLYAWMCVCEYYVVLGRRE